MKVFTQNSGVKTLEPAFVEANVGKLHEIAELVGFKREEPTKQELIDYIGKDNNKTTWALSVLMSESTDFEIPQYINESIKWVYGQ